MKTIIFRVDSSDRLGSGHVFRCVNLARHINKKKFKILFVCKNFRGNFIDYIKKNRFKVLINRKFSNYPKKKLSLKSQIQDANFIIKKNLKKICLVVVDQPQLNFEWRKKIKPFCSKIFLIDDIYNDKKYCDFHLNHNLNKFKNKIINDNKSLLHGIKYLLVGKNLKLKKRIIKKNQKIFVYLGSVDSKQVTQKLVNFMKKRELADYKFFVMIGRNNKFKKNIRFNAIYKNIAYLKDNIINFQNFYNKIDVVISAINTTMYEQLKYGFKPIVVAQNKFQLKIGTELHRKNYVKLINLNNINTNKLKNMIDRHTNFFSQKSNSLSILKENSVKNIAEIIQRGIY